MILLQIAVLAQAQSVVRPVDMITVLRRLFTTTCMVAVAAHSLRVERLHRVLTLSNEFSFSYSFGQNV